MKTFYRVDKRTNRIDLYEFADDLIDLICHMRDNATKDGRFWAIVEEYLINKFWDWQCEHPEEVDPTYKIFDSREAAQKQQQENRLTDKINEEIKKEINLVERNRLKQVHEFVEGIRSLEVEEEGEK